MPEKLVRGSVAPLSTFGFDEADLSKRHIRLPKPDGLWYDIPLTQMYRLARGKNQHPW